MSHPALVELDTSLQGIYAAFKQIQMEAGQGCRGLIEQHPTDPVPLINALGAIGQRVEKMCGQIDMTWNDIYMRSATGDANLWASNEGARMARDATRWMRQQWDQIDVGWRAHQFTSMWPQVQAALSEPARCTGCGGELGVTQGMTAQRMPCPFCGVENQVQPPPVAATYYHHAPHVFADRATLELKYKLQELRDSWETERNNQHMQTGDYPDEPLVWLQERERQERAYWTQYAEVMAQTKSMTPEAKQELIDSRLKFFYDEMARNEVWRAAHGMGDVEVSIPDNMRDVVDWGPLTPDQVHEFYVHEFLLREVETDPAKHQQALTKLGYRDALHRKLVEQTFNRHHEPNMVQPWFQEQMGQAAMAAMQRRGELFADAHADKLAPIEGISIELYGELAAHQGRTTSPDAFLLVLAKHNLDREKYDRVAEAWQQRMSTDTDGIIAPAFSKGFMAAGAAGSEGGGIDPTSVSFEKYCEISGAQAAWSEQGKDISVMLQEHFQMTAVDFSQVAMHWSQAMMTDMNMMMQMSTLIEQYQAQWRMR